MKTYVLLLIAQLAILALAQGQESLRPVPDQYIVVLKNTVAQPAVLSKTPSRDRELALTDARQARDVNKLTVQSLLRDQQISTNKLTASYEDVLVGFSAILSAAEVERLRSDSRVEGVYNDYFVSATPIPEEPRAPEASEVGQTTTCAVTNAGGFADGSAKRTWIWILDSGIDLDHPDLNVMTAAPYAKSCIPGETPEDGTGHGTHCAGIAAAKNNSIGVVGVSAGATVVPVKVINSYGEGNWSQLIAGLNHVAQYCVEDDVANLSLGADNVSNCENANPVLRDAIRNLGKAGVWVCIAAGNNSCDAAKSLPGCINGDRVFTVGSITCSQGCSNFSNFNATPVDWVATGSSVYSTYKNGGYSTLSGTSMATPVVAGICHARGAAPVSGGKITCGNSCVTKSAYQKAKRN